MKLIKLDRTELFNLLTVIATLILSGGDLLSLQIPEVIPEFGVPIILFIAVAVNYFSRSQVKDQAANAKEAAKAILFTDASHGRIGIVGDEGDRPDEDK